MTVSLSELKSIKNSVIGNPLAKVKVAHDGSIPFLVDLLNPPHSGVHEQVAINNPLRIEAAHVISSIACGSTEALRGLLFAHAHRQLLYAIAHFALSDPPSLKSSIVRAFRSLAVSCADVVGPSLWGLGTEHLDMKNEARAVLDEIFELDNLDIVIPLILDPNPDIALSAIQVLAYCTRIPVHKSTVTNWRPSSERSKLLSRRGWEKLNGIKSVDPHFGGGWVARHLTLLLDRHVFKIQEAVLLALAALTHDNEWLSQGLYQNQDAASGIPFMAKVCSFLTARQTSLRLSAALCVTRIIRSCQPPVAGQEHYQPPLVGGDVISTLFLVLGRIVESPVEAQSSRGKACYILSFLSADDREIQRIACESGILVKIAKLLDTVESALVDDWLDEELKADSRLKEAVFTSIASLTMHRPDVRRELIDSSVISLLQSALVHPDVAVRFAACSCARALSRSVHVLRTSVIDTGIGERLFSAANDPAEDRRIRATALAAICNLVNNYSPFRELLFERDGLQSLVALLDSETDEAMQVNALWAIKNTLHKSKTAEKISIMDKFSWSRLSRYLNSPSDSIREQAMFIVRNLAVPQSDIGILRSGLSDDVLLGALESGIESHNPDLLVQVLQAFRNLAFGPVELREELVGRPRLLEGMKESLQHTDVRVRRAASQCVLQLVKAIPRRHGKLRENGIDQTLRLMYNNGAHSSPHGHITGISQMGYEDKQVRNDIKNAIEALDFIRH